MHLIPWQHRMRGIFSQAFFCCLYIVSSEVSAKVSCPLLVKYWFALEEHILENKPWAVRAKRWDFQDGPQNSICNYSMYTFMETFADLITERTREELCRFKSESCRKCCWEEAGQVHLGLSPSRYSHTPWHVRSGLSEPSPGYLCRLLPHHPLICSVCAAGQSSGRSPPAPGIPAPWVCKPAAALHGPTLGSLPWETFLNHYPDKLGSWQPVMYVTLLVTTL